MLDHLNEPKRSKLRYCYNDNFFKQFSLHDFQLSAILMYFPALYCTKQFYIAQNSTCIAKNRLYYFFSYDNSRVARLVNGLIRRNALILLAILCINFHTVIRMKDYHRGGLTDISLKFTWNSDDFVPVEFSRPILGPIYLHSYQGNYWHTMKYQNLEHLVNEL